MPSLKKNIFFNLSGQVSLAILGFISLKYIYAGLGDDALGLIYFSLTLSTLLVSAMDFGLSKTTIREVAAYHISDPDYVKRLIQTFSLFYWVAYLLVVLLFVIFLPAIVNSWIHLETMDSKLAQYVLLVMGSTAFLAIPKTFMSSVCIGLQRMDVKNYTDVSLALIQQIGMIFLLVTGSNLVVVAYWMAITNIFSILLYIIVICKFIPIGAFFPRFSMEVVIRTKKFASKMLWTSVLLA